MNYFPNFIIVRGTGRNVGKTLSACSIISNLTGEHEPVGVKISPHFHELKEYPEYLHNSEDFVIVEEKFISKKDSSRMLQAGAKKVFYIQAKNNRVTAAVKMLTQHFTPETPVIVESGGLYDFVEPALLLNIIGRDKRKNIGIRKNTTALFVPSEKVSSYNWERIDFNDGKFRIHA